MAQFGSDNFDDTDGITLSTHNAAWTRHTSYTVNAQIAANRVRQSATGNSVYWHSGSPASADYSVSSDLFMKEPQGGQSYVGVAGRINTAGNTFYVARYAGGATDGWQLAKFVGGSFTSLGVSAQSTVDETSYNVKLEMIGTAIKLYKEGSGTALISVTDSAITAAGKAGIYFSDDSSASDTTGIHIDNFSADEGGGAGTSFPFRRSSFQHMLVR